MQRRQRLNRIVAAIAGRPSVRTTELAEEFGVSLATIRRDLEELEQQQLVSRTHGGVKPHVAFNDIPLRLKLGEASAEKTRIAARAAAMIGDAHVIGMSGGTTTSEFARHLADRTGLTIVTNAINIAADLATSRFRIFIAGGELRSSSLETVGSTTERAFADYNIDITFLGVDGIDAKAGCTNYDPIGAQANAALAHRSQTRVILADASKIGRVALAPVLPISDIDVLITDSRAPSETVEAIRRGGCEVICA